MKKKISDTIEAGELTEFRDVVYLAQTLRRGIPCRKQCAMYDDEKGLCTGYCWRWANGSDIVFRRVIASVGCDPTAVTVQTPDIIEEHIMAIYAAKGHESNLKYQEKLKAANETKRRRKYGTGSLSEVSKGYRGEFVLDGKRYTYKNKDKAEVERWLDEMNKKKKS